MAFLILFMFASINAWAAGSRGIDVFMVLDNSGSMIKNDREGLRFQAAKKFIRKLNIGDGIGVINFETKTEIQIPITEIKNNADLQTLEDQIVPVNSRRDTDVYAALQVAYDEMKNTAKSNNTKFFIMLTDGEIDPGREFRVNENFRKKYYEQLDNLIEQYEENIWPIFVVFLNPQGLEDDYLKGIARRTGGDFYNLDDAHQLEDIFSGIADKIEAIKGDLEKAVDAKIAEEAGGLPDITVDIISPAEGGKYYSGEKMNIEARIVGNDGRLIERPLAEIDSFDVEIVEPGREDTIILNLNDLGELGDAKKGDGIYSASKSFEEIGKYEFRFRVSGRFSGIPFIVDSRSDTDILPPAVINIGLKDESAGIQEVMQGKKLKVHLDFTPGAESQQVIEFEASPESDISIKPIRASILPNRPEGITIKLPISAKTPVGEQKIILKVNTFGKGIKIEPTELTIHMIVMPYNFIESNRLAICITAGVIVLGLIVIGIVLLSRLLGKAVEKKRLAGHTGRDVLGRFREGRENERVNEKINL
ncbi:MAG: VWA domain-containing protein [Clostridiales bacterium]|nr:VWA domain-containing protein [Clostridiales bacterium]